MSEPYGYDAIQEAAAAVRARDGRTPDVAIVLGSGLGSFADGLSEPTVIPYGELPQFPISTVSGHAGRLVIGRSGGRVVAAMQGRVHRYEGWPLPAVVFPVRVLHALGARALVLTNAAGAVQLAPGSLMSISDHINFVGENPLEGPNDPRLGTRFPDMSTAYHPDLRAALARVAKASGILLHEGVYAYSRGPSYETPAEIRALRMLGADAVGMSTIHEAIAAAHLGLPCCGVSCITNLAAGISPTPLSHVEVEETARRVRDTFTALLAAAVPELPLL